MAEIRIFIQGDYFVAKIPDEDGDFFYVRRFTLQRLLEVIYHYDYYFDTIVMDSEVLHYAVSL